MIVADEITRCAPLLPATSSRIATTTHQHRQDDLCIVVEGRPLPDERPKGRSDHLVSALTGSRAAHRGQVLWDGRLFLSRHSPCSSMEAARTEAGVNHRSGPSPHFPT